MIMESDKNRIILFEDEAGFSLHPKLGRIWTKKGSQPVVRTKSQHQKRLSIYGWVDVIDGLHGIMKWPKGNTDGFLALLKKLAYKFKNHVVEVWVDRARWHKGHRIESFLAMHSHITICYIPAYHPELNSQEILWRTMRYEETTNVYFKTIEELEVSIFKRSQRWKPKKIKSLCQLT